jgi:hypothetical protein
MIIRGLSVSVWKKVLKLYTGIGLILLLGFAFWCVHKQSYNSGVNAERTKWQAQIVKESERKAKAENVITEQKVIWRDRVRTVERIVVDCQLPDNLVSVLRESGVFVGQVRNSVNP